MALEMAMDKKGNCHRFTALFAMLASRFWDLWIAKTSCQRIDWEEKKCYTKN